MSFEFRPLWQLGAKERAEVALDKAQATRIYAELKLWPAETLARLAETQRVEDNTYPGAAAVFADAGASGAAATDARGRCGCGDGAAVADFDPAQPRDPQGRWTAGAGSSGAATVPLSESPEPRRQEPDEKEPEDTPALAMSEDCAQEWRDAFDRCERLLALPNPDRRLTGGYKNLRDCARGFVSARCGGNPV